MNKRFLVILTDFLLCMFIFFLGLTGYLYTQQSAKENSKGNIEDRSEYIIEATWQDGSPHDIDLFVKTPNKSVTWYKKPADGLLTLDRDDQGTNNTSKDAIGHEVVSTSRREVISIRKSIPGTYAVNVFFFAKKDAGPAIVKVTVRKLNPYKEISERTFTMDKARTELTALTFDIDEHGNFVGKDETAKVSIVKELLP